MTILSLICYVKYSDNESLEKILHDEIIGKLGICTSRDTFWLDEVIFHWPEITQNYEREHL